MCRTKRELNVSGQKSGCKDLTRHVTSGRMELKLRISISEHHPYAIPDIDN